MNKKKYRISCKEILWTTKYPFIEIKCVDLCVIIGRSAYAAAGQINSITKIWNIYENLSQANDKVFVTGNFTQTKRANNT